MTNLMTLTPTILKQMAREDLPALSADIRQFLIASVSQTGGHIGAALGVVELTIALHHVFDSSQDKIIFDTGHQGYTHRILTGRANQFPTLNTFGGMSRFLDRADSPHDHLSASHAGTAISTAVGIAQAMEMAGDLHRIVAVVGDGTLGEGLTWEGLNYLGGTKLPILVVLNDNQMSIPPTVGGIAYMLKGHERPGHWFAGLGIQYHRIDDGHDLVALIEFCTDYHQSYWQYGPTVLHIKAEKGRGLPCAASHPFKMHFSMPFDPATGAGASPTIAGRTYATVAAETLHTVMAEDEKIVVLTPGTPYASALDQLLACYPSRVLDVGMAEQHAVSMAAGLALGGRKPVVCVQSTFLQRAYDQVLHDVSFLNLPVTFLVVRSGFAGYDSPTHHGLWDIPVLRSFPNMQIHYAMDTQDLQATLTARLGHPQGPLALLMPYEPVLEPEPEIAVRYDGYGMLGTSRHGTIFCLGNTFALAREVCAQLQEDHAIDFGILLCAKLKPFRAFQGLAKEVQDGSIRPERPSHIVTIEEGILAGGLGSLVAEAFLDAGAPVSLLRFGVGDCFVPAGSKQECAQALWLDVETIVAAIINRWSEEGRA